MGITLLLAFAAVALASPRAAADIRAPLGDDAYAVLWQGRMLFLECEPPVDEEAGKAYLAEYLADADAWETYAGKGSVAIRFDNLNAETQRRILLTIFEYDYVEERGWFHFVRFSGPDQETLWSLCEWLTGDGKNYKRVAELNRLNTTTLSPGQEILVPYDLLTEVMRTPTPTLLPEPDPFALLEVAPEKTRELSIVERGGETYGLYRLKQGEALYTAVVVRFTDFRDNAAILEACETVQKVSGIKDVRAMEPGTEILIPVSMLTARYQPEGSPERKQFEQTIREAQRLRGAVKTKDLEGVVVILDAGHGGRDQGASTSNGGRTMYEDEVNYDIVCRIKQLLEAQTRAKVHVLNRDLSQGYKPANVQRFVHDTDEVLLTTPPYKNTDATTSAHLRCYLANSILRKEVKNGADPLKVVFTSVHTDSLYNENLRGAMVYIPGARYRRDSERPRPHSRYSAYAEAREAPTFVSNAEERGRDEALSRNFAAALLKHLGRHRIKRHDQKGSDPIRNVIRKSRNVEYVPAVIRNTAVPTKILIETGNMCNPTDRRWLSEPWWRQRFAEAYVDALREFYGS